DHADPIALQEREAVPLLLPLADDEVLALTVAQGDRLLLRAVGGVLIGDAGPQVAAAGLHVAALVLQAVVVGAAGGGRLRADGDAAVAHQARLAVSVGEAALLAGAEARQHVARQARGAVFVGEAFEAAPLDAALS